MIAKLYPCGLDGYQVYINELYECETYSLEKAIKLAKLLGATQIIVKGVII